MFQEGWGEGQGRLTNNFLWPQVVASWMPVAFVSSLDRSLDKFRILRKFHWTVNTRTQFLLIILFSGVYFRLLNLDSCAQASRGCLFF